ncbi:MAG: type III pantothenate kinase [Endomicrobiales bacterium]|nr:type III pantothenate kinase [Endomicrobiales bacterium]
MLLIFDIGNTNITIGLYKNPNVPLCNKILRLTTDKKAGLNKYAKELSTILVKNNIDAKNITSVAIASVVPELDSVFAKLSKNIFKCGAYFVSYTKSKGLLKYKYPKPQEIGADRIANAVAGYKLCGGPLIVVDFGTATTFDCISKDGKYMGGAIAPGPLLSLKALSISTSKLPVVVFSKSSKYIGKNTVECMQSGIFFGYVGLIKGLIDGISNEIGKNVKVIATGGLAVSVCKNISKISAIVPELTLEGIRLLWKKNTLPVNSVHKIVHKKLK